MSTNQSRICVIILIRRCRADPEPIFLCEELRLCSVNDNARGNISSIVSAPKSAPIGATVTVNVAFTVVNTIGTGQIVIEIVPPQGDVLGTYPHC